MKLAVATRQQVSLPVKYLGVGEKAEDLTLFKLQDFVDAVVAESASSTVPPSRASSPSPPESEE
ncbi:MAG TPA: hypothetical protein VGJ26_22590 [Pirellulales bacterium]